MTNGSESLREHVASGNYRISKEKSVSLEAYLGTCVGVTLCDRQEGIGGLIHLLLPEPTGLNRPWKSETYASTGLPLFIQASLEAGAKKENLEACIAGGALVGPVTRQDLDLDIGGRTSEIVQTLLKEEGIPIHKAETGGYFSCRMSLDIKSLQTSIHPLSRQNSFTRSEFNKPTSDEIALMVNLVQPIPQIALKITRMIRDGNYKMSEVAREIKQDQVISAKVIRLCNSAFIGLKKKIDSIDRALVIMGERHLLQLILSASLEKYYSDSIQGYSLCKGGLFHHALGTAMVAEELAKFTSKAPPDIAYTAGLLHDIGKVVLDQYISPAYPFFYRRTQIDRIELCEAEKESIGLTHPEAGGLLGESWSLPENLIDTIRHHHYPERSTNDPQLTHLIYLADLLMSRFQVGQELECLNMDRFSYRLKEIGLSASQLPIIVDLIPREIFDASYH
ncbi:MAG: HDOD domain-containing protein [Pseudomonadota bacterium]